jgi:hypothetical protein
MVRTHELIGYTNAYLLIAMQSLTIAITLVFNQYVNPVALERLHWKYYLVYCVWLLFEVRMLLPLISFYPV